jgi:hypothetical protein
MARVECGSSGCENSVLGKREARLAGWAEGRTWTCPECQAAQRTAQDGTDRAKLIAIGAEAAIPNRFSGTCACGTRVAERAGYAVRSNGRWTVLCARCWESGTLSDTRQGYGEDEGDNEPRCADRSMGIAGEPYGGEI